LEYEFGSKDVVFIGISTFWISITTQTFGLGSTGCDMINANEQIARQVRADTLGLFWKCHDIIHALKRRAGTYPVSLRVTFTPLSTHTHPNAEY